MKTVKIFEHKTNSYALLNIPVLTPSALLLYVFCHCHCQRTLKRERKYHISHNSVDVGDTTNVQTHYLLLCLLNQCMDYSAVSGCSVYPDTWSHFLVCILFCSYRKEFRFLLWMIVVVPLCGRVGNIPTHGSNRETNNSISSFEGPIFPHTIFFHLNSHGLEYSCLWAIHCLWDSYGKSMHDCLVMLVILLNDPRQYRASEMTNAFCVRTLMGSKPMNR